MQGASGYSMAQNTTRNTSPKAWNTHAEYPLYWIDDPGNFNGYLSDGTKQVPDLLLIHN